MRRGIRVVPRAHRPVPIGDGRFYYWRDDLLSVNRVLIAIATLFAVFIMSCGDDSETVLPNASPARATPPAATATPAPEETAIESRQATPGLKPSEGDTPAAGICLGPTSEAVVTIEFLDGIPDPRCSFLTPDQRIRFVNRLQDPVTLTIGRYSGTVAPNSSLLFDAPVGSYLAVGVHTVDASVPGARAELILREAP